MTEEILYAIISALKEQNELLSEQNQLLRQQLNTMDDNHRTIKSKLDDIYIKLGFVKDAVYRIEDK